MANDRYRYDPDRDRDWRRMDETYGGRASGRPADYDDRLQEEDGYIARRGFGNRSAGFDRDRSDRDYGDSAGYGTGGSARDWRDVVGDDRRRSPSGYGAEERGRGPSPGYRSPYDA